MTVFILAVTIHTILPRFQLIVSVGCIFHLEEHYVIGKTVTNSLCVAFYGKLRCVRISGKVLAWSPCKGCALCVSHAHSASCVLNWLALLVSLYLASVGIEPSVRWCANCLVCYHLWMKGYAAILMLLYDEHGIGGLRVFRGGLLTE